MVVGGCGVRGMMVGGCGVRGMVVGGCGVRGMMVGGCGVRGMVVGGCGEVNFIRKMTCRKLREARKRRVGVVTWSQLWEKYRRAKMEVKNAIMNEKKKLRKRTVRKIKERGDTCFGLT